MDIIRAQENNTQLHEQFNKQVNFKIISFKYFVSAKLIPRKLTNASFRT